MRLRPNYIAPIALLCVLLPAILWLWSPHQRSGRPAALVITRGGTYTGSWESNDANVPVILIKTAEPVLIEGCTLRGRGNLIETRIEHANVTVRKTHCVGLNPNVREKSPGRFFSGESFDRVTIENNDLENTAGIYLLSYAGDFRAEHTIKILRNRALNIDGRKSDGVGGFLNDAAEVQFVQLDKVRHLPGIEIAWNQVINQPGRSAVEDVINIYKSSGTRQSPIRIHDNYIQGAYPPDPMSKNYSGGGILLADGSAERVEDASGFVEACDNQVIDTTNYGIAISAGHDGAFHHNRILSTGMLENRKPLPAQNVGAYIWDVHHDGRRMPPTFFNNAGHENVIGWVRGERRNDWWVPDAAEWKDNVHWPGEITAASAAAERQRWDQKVQEHRLQIGVKCDRNAEAPLERSPDQPWPMKDLSRAG